MEGLFITIEGGEGAGKSTQIERIATWLEDRGETTTVSLHDENGQLDNSAIAKKLNTLLYQQLR